MFKSHQSLKKTGVKRAFCRKKLNQVFFHLNNKSIKKSIIYSQLVIVIIKLIPNSAFAITPVILLGDPAQLAENTEKACSLMCQLALVGNKFLHTTEGKSAFMWLGYYGIMYGAKSLGFVAMPALGHSAMLIALFCSSTYGMSILLDGEAIKQSEAVQIANSWCVRSYAVLVGASSFLPMEAINMDKGMAFLKAFANAKDLSE